MAKRERVNTDVSIVPVPNLYLVQSDSGLWHLITNREYGRFTNQDERDHVDALCGYTISVSSEEDLIHFKDWLTKEDIIENFTADEIFDDLKPFEGGGCGNCLQAAKNHDFGSAKMKI